MKRAEDWEEETDALEFVHRQEFARLESVVHAQSSWIGHAMRRIFRLELALALVTIAGIGFGMLEFVRR